MKHFRFSVVILLAVILLAFQASAGGVKNLPGYIDLNWIEIPSDADEIHDIDLGSVLLGIASDAEEAGDSELAHALTMVKSIRVKAFSADDLDRGQVEKMIKKIQGQLKDDDWERLVYIKDNKETFTVSTKYEDGNMVGLMVVAYEESEQVAFVNVVGDLDLAALIKLGLGFEELNLDDLLDNLDDSRDY